MSTALSGRPVIEVPPMPDWAAITAAVEAALAPGSGLSRQRRHENMTASRQGRLWMRDAGLTVMPPYPFACECGTSRCRATWMGTPDDYTARTVPERPLIAHDTPAEATPASP